MARCEVIQIKCDRCKRVELRPPSPPKAAPDYEMQFRGRRIRYDDLCVSCAEALSRLVDMASEWQREVKQPFGPTVAPNEAPPLQVAPKYVPAQPHAAGAKR